MWKFEHTIETEASAKALWSLYSDVSTWTTWDKEIEDVKLNGPFTVGTTGTMKPIGQDPLFFKLVEVRENEGFVDETEIPGAGVLVIFTHTLKPLENGNTRISHQVTIIGPTADVLGPQIGPAIILGIPKTMESLATVALAIR